MRKPPPTETNKQLKGPECEGGAWQGEWEGFQEQKVVKWTRVTIRNSPFPQPLSLSLFSHPAHSVQVRLFSDFWEQKRKRRIGAGRGGWSATAAEEGWLFSPSGSNGGGDWWPRGAELCADMSSTPHPPEHSLWHGVIVRAHKQGSREKKWHLVLASQLISDFCRERTLATNTLKSYKCRHMHTHHYLCVKLPKALSIVHSRT